MKPRAGLTVLIALPLLALTLGQGERDFAMSNLHSSRKLFLDAIHGLSEAQWKFKPAPDRWSIADCAEHITLSEPFLFQVVQDKVLKAPAAPPAAKPGRDADEAVIRKIRDRSKKASAPEPLRPSGRFTTAEDVAQDFKQARGLTIRFVESTGEDLRSHTMDKMDAYQWILFISAHTERHVAQINEVKADPQYPGN